MSFPKIEEKVALLLRPESYAEMTSRVDVKETHMSWVFLTDRHAFKMKKPVRNEVLDYSTLEARRRTCEDEVRLNRPLAASVYLGIVPITLDARGVLALGGAGRVIEWLVKMRRLPEELMLDRAIAAGAATDDEARRVGAALAFFYRTAPALALELRAYRSQLSQELAASASELARPEYDLPSAAVRAMVDEEEAFLVRHSEMLESRIAAGRIIEAHGDLRPEHICLEESPVVIDRLEFNRSLRVLDVASELTFLWLECERLGAPDFGRQVFAACCHATGDAPPEELLAFYKRYHACIRAKVAVWHLRDGNPSDHGKWIERARQYLRLALSDTGVAMPGVPPAG